MGFGVSVLSWTCGFIFILIFLLLIVNLSVQLASGNLGLSINLIIVHWHMLNLLDRGLGDGVT